MPWTKDGFTDQGYTNGGCMVCTDREWVGIWEDADGFTLRACGREECVRGYTYVRSALDWFLFHWGDRGGSAAHDHFKAMARVRARKAAAHAASVQQSSTRDGESHG